ncbi:gephyrin-like molybdotransferase Glp [Clostridium formicaceticum]|uniref:Molybdopterin molybdenumtransferase n=1 Tax=Clostridium formicaceticum TaxID=1497 RepID=A0AAC9RL68_9CLOT|nr:gephyrin-like molybdotransferase Glp [Clostridium formicaceticum]AOY76630.1 molybdopterin molybdenumtransferase MoeA [Clostridium formicaceticum]ARE87053.1 Molybdopterin molybdenumtransferase [Clostridium formicaceticum]
MELLSTLTMKEAREKLKEVFAELALPVEEISILKALSCIVHEDIKATINVPEFNRSTVDGYAVIAKDTYGASEALPSFLKSIGEVAMGKSTELALQSGECCYVPTGGMIPKNSDGVVMIEYTEVLEDNTVCIQNAVAPKENILQFGEDISKGQVIFKKGHKLRPQDIGVLAGMGITRVKVYKKPRVSIISTGDEIVAPEEEVKLGQIKDMNTYSLATAALQDRCDVMGMAVVKDDLGALKKKIEDFLETSDIVLVSGGSSMGTKDVTKDAINAIGDPGVFIHGLAVKPGKPTIIGKVKNKAVFGLPGQPVSALVVYQTLVTYLIKNLYGDESPVPYITGELTVNIASAPGREHYVMVKISEDDKKIVVSPVHGKSGMLTMMTKSMGYVKIDTNQEGLLKGENVKVYLF